MLKKIEKSYLFLSQNLELLRCPICKSGFDLERYALICQNGHTFNLNKKGYVNFLQIKADTEHYTKKMFEPRRRLIEAGMYDPLLEELVRHLPAGDLLDVGTGEGTFLAKIQKARSEASDQASQASENVFDSSVKNSVGLDQAVKSVFGFDIAKDGIEMATNLDMTGFMSLSDLTNLPFADGAFAAVLNIFTPSNYQEFHRVLQAKGWVLKVVPDRYYLQEIRRSYGMAVDYDNQAVLDRFKAEYPDCEQVELHYVFDLPEALRLDFLEMSPLEWAISPEQKQAAQANPPRQATIHLQLLIGQED